MRLWIFDNQEPLLSISQNLKGGTGEDSDPALFFGSSGKSVLMPFVDAPRGQDISARGNALGIGMIRTCALKGHDMERGY